MSDPYHLAIEEGLKPFFMVWGSSQTNKTKHYRIELSLHATIGNNKYHRDLLRVFAVADRKKKVN